MTDDQLLALLSKHEDNFVERKSEGVTASELRQTVCAFANSVPEGRHGVLFVGIHDKTGDITGVGNTDQLQKRVREAAQNDCYPPITYTAAVLTVEGKQVVAVIVPQSADKPHFSGPAYVRIGSESPKASQQQYEELILSRNDKAREILRHRNGVLTVLGQGYQLGSNKPLPDAAYREMRECRLLNCTAHLVTLEDIASGEQFSEPLAHVTISYDHKRRRAQLMVRFSS